MKKIKIQLVEDNLMVIQCLKSLLGKEDDFEVVACTTSLDTVLKDAYTNKPDIILMDVNMNNILSFKYVKEIQNNLKNTKVLALSGYEDNKLIKKMFEAGVEAYLSKSTTKQQLFEIIREVSENTYKHNNTVIVGSESFRLGA